MNRVIKAITAPPADSTLDIFMRDVVGDKSDAASGVIATTTSIMAYLKALVEKTPQLVAGTVDTSPLATMDIFSIDGGPVMVHEIFGIVTTVIQTQATTVDLALDPDDGGANVELDGATTDASAFATGTIIRWTKDFSDDLTSAVDASEVGAAAIYTPGVIMMIGDIVVTYGATSTGVINWYCLYTSLGGVITAG